MSFLSDADIRRELANGNIICRPFIDKNLSVASIDLTLGNTLKIVRRNIIDRFFPKSHRFDINDHGKITVIDDPKIYKSIDLFENDYLLKPNEFAIAHTLEYVGQTVNYIQSDICDKSTPSRLGLSCCFSSSFIDPGNALNITLELKNNGHLAIPLKFGMHICQIRFSYLNNPCFSGYTGKYLNSTSAETAK